MREILYRGKRVHTGKWIQGYYIKIFGMSHIEIPGSEKENASFTAYTVNSKTIGQYTGMLDKNDTKIFEGDIVRNKNKYFQFVGIVKYQNGQFVVDWKLHQRVSNGVISSTVTHHLGNADEVIGNIYDNPELLNEE